jgi:hypothetical protein
MMILGKAAIHRSPRNLRLTQAPHAAAMDSGQSADHK